MSDDELHVHRMSVEMATYEAWEAYMQEIIDELVEKKLARTPANAAIFWRNKNYPSLDYGDISRIFWLVLNDPAQEHTYNRIIGEE